VLRSNRKSLGNHVVSPEEEKERLQWEGFVEKEGLKRALDEKSFKIKEKVTSATCVRNSKSSVNNRQASNLVN